MNGEPLPPVLPKYWSNRPHPPPPADLEAGIGARDVEEPFAVETADLHVFDRLGLDGKIGRLCPSNRDQTRRAAEEKAFDHLHRDLQSLPCGRVPSPPGAPHPRKVPLSPRCSSDAL